LGTNTLPIFFLPKNSFFFDYGVKEGQIKKWGENGGKGCKYITFWFKPNKTQRAVSISRLGSNQTKPKGL